MKTHLKKAAFAILFILVGGISLQAQNPRLVVRSDDMGAFHSVNVACIEAYKNGIETTIEVMPVTPWFPEAVKMLRENPGVDVGIHLAITSEWENFKWRPLTQCPSLTDANGYFYPMMHPNKAYPNQSITENDWKLNEIEQEFRAQIELVLKNIPQASHLTGHMGAIRFDQDVLAMVHRLAEEYNLTFVEGDDLKAKYSVQSVWYDGPSKTSQEKEASFINMLSKLEKGKSYIFLDHPAINNAEIETIGHIGYEWVAEDRQGVTDFMTSERVKQAVADNNITLINYNELTKALPRSTPKAEKVAEKGIKSYLAAVEKSGQDLHSLMILRNGNVVYENWFGENAANKTHIMNSVSKTFTATALGFAVSEGRLKVTDKVINFFPDQLPQEVSPFLRELTIEHLLTMSAGQNPTISNQIRKGDNDDWVAAFLATPFVYQPGTVFEYNSMASYMVSAIVQQVTGEKLTDYLYPRLFRPLGIAGINWTESPQGVNHGGWGLYVKTEDMAKMGQFILQRGEWKGKQLLPASWFDDMTSAKISTLPREAKKEDLKDKIKESDWLQGYGYQMWQCRHNAFRADGAKGQLIVILPEKNAVIVATANIDDMQAEINLIWKHLLPSFK
ncbi:ChbG/HpnK family deacetylase [Dysgonomonas sp. 25]|uniref:ChbG/HpnK family deacetylase n=1 Tax=Dysgonomonas sp. 25 TaxID=2302933 RepID=UPI0013CFE9C8|nr:ChbG/HpnK family deacetylase [Dysgonomonas sp. 25]NDV70248.1 ChbG/HpnK family deacetylase [Dysgonomonas sp. 25]